MNWCETEVTSRTTFTAQWSLCFCIFVHGRTQMQWSLKIQVCVCEWVKVVLGRNVLSRITRHTFALITSRAIRTPMTSSPHNLMFTVDKHMHPLTNTCIHKHTHMHTHTNINEDYVNKTFKEANVVWPNACTNIKEPFMCRLCVRVHGPVGLCLSMSVPLHHNLFHLWFPAAGVRGQLALIRGQHPHWPLLSTWCW